MKPSLSRTRQYLATRLPRHAPGRAATALMAVLAILLAAHWITRLTAPRPVARLPESRSVAAPPSLEPVYRLYGVRAEAAPALGNVALTGVFAAGGGQGFATFRVSGGQASALRGGEVMPGLILLRVAQDHVVLGSDAGEQRLPLTKDAAAPAVAGKDR
jgi:hypothetical protein